MPAIIYRIIAPNFRGNNAVHAIAVVRLRLLRVALRLPPDRGIIRVMIKILSRGMNKPPMRTRERATREHPRIPPMLAQAARLISRRSGEIARSKRRSMVRR